MNQLDLSKTKEPSVNIIGSFNLAFHNQHDIAELKRLMYDLNIKINIIIPEGASVQQLKNLPKAWFNLVPYREIGLLTAEYLKKNFNIPFVNLTPMGIVETAKCIRKIQKRIIN